MLLLLRDGIGLPDGETHTQGAHTGKMQEIACLQQVLIPNSFSSLGFPTAELV
jgi:hypothetical protein